MMNTKVLLVGAGSMAQSYFDVLQFLEVDYDIVCRAESSALSFEREKDFKPIIGGLAGYLESNTAPTHAIVAVGVEALASVTMFLLNAGVKEILVEKPASLYQRELSSLVVLAQRNQANVYVAYNRRFYASVDRLSKIVSSDGGLRSIYFDFTEWSDRIAPLEKAEGVKQRWLLSNSSHVIDLAFYLAGRPKELTAFSTGQLNWHKRGSCFTGSGVTENGVLFSYRADWDAPGRWCLKAYTKHHRLELSPLESLIVTERNSVSEKDIRLADDIDRDFKPGLMKQVQAFFSGNNAVLCSIDEQLANYPFYIQMAGYEG